MFPFENNKHHFCTPLFWRIWPLFRLCFHRWCCPSTLMLSIKFGIILCCFDGSLLISFYVQPFFTMNSITRLFCPCVIDFLMPFRWSSSLTIVTHCWRSPCNPRAQPTQSTATHDPTHGLFLTREVHAHGALRISNKCHIGPHHHYGSSLATTTRPCHLSFLLGLLHL